MKKFFPIFAIFLCYTTCGCMSGPLDYSFPYYNDFKKEDAEEVRRLNPSKNNVWAQTDIVPVFYNRRTLTIKNGLVEATCRTRMPHIIPKTNEVLGTICIRRSRHAMNGNLVRGLEEHQINPVLRFAFTWNGMGLESWNIEFFKGLAGAGNVFDRTYVRLFWKIYLGDKCLRHKYHNRY